MHANTRAAVRSSLKQGKIRQYREQREVFMSKVSIVGAYNTHLVLCQKDKETGEVTDLKSIYDLMLEAGRGAIADAAIEAKDIDGVWGGLVCAGAFCQSGTSRGLCDGNRSMRCGSNPCTAARMHARRARRPSITRSMRSRRGGPILRLCLASKK